MKNGTLVPILGALISVRGWFHSGFGRLPERDRRPRPHTEDVFAVAAQGLAWTRGEQAVARLAKSSISAARSKVGRAPLQALHERACVPLASARKPPHAF